MNIDNKFLFVCVQLIIVVLMSVNVSGIQDVSTLVELKPIQTDISSSPERLTNSRAYRLYNQCAFKEVVIQNRVSAVANDLDDKGELVLEALKTEIMSNEVKIRIRGLTSGKYLCFNLKGRLVAKPKKKALALGENCQFIEVLNGQYWSFKSVANEHWYIGFNHKGQPLYGSAHVATNREDCFRFAKKPSQDHLTRNRFSVDEHNRQVVQIHPGISAPEFLYSTSLKSSHHFRHQKNGKSTNSPRQRHIKKSQRNRKSSLPKTRADR